MTDATRQLLAAELAEVLARYDVSLSEARRAVSVALAAAETETEAWKLRTLETEDCC